MAKYLISFPSAAMKVPDSELEAVGRDAYAVIRETKEAGVYVFAGGIDETVPPVLVSADGSVAEATRGRLRSMVDSLYLSCLRVRRPSHGPHVSRKRVAVIRSFEYSGLIQSREVGVLLYILPANIQNA